MKQKSVLETSGKGYSANQAAEIHRNAVEHGWWEEDRAFGEIVALCHSELSEALEEYRAGRPNVWYKCMKNPSPNDKNCGMCPFENDGTCEVPELELKPEGIAVEMIDCLIRILDWCGKEKLDVEKIVQRKHEYNKNRPYRHGGKKI